MDLLRTIISVEDSDDDFETIDHVFQRWSQARGARTLQLKRVETGEECLALLSGASSGTKPIVLLDLNLPGQGGRATLKQIKEESTLHSVPVVVLSSSSAPKDISFCHAHGVNAYHVKPLRYEDFTSMLNIIFDYWSLTELETRAPL